MSLLAKVTTKAPSLPSRVVLYAGEKWGKSSFAAHAPKPLFLMTAGETGLLSLIEAGKVPEVPHLPEDFHSWHKLVDTVRELRDAPHDFQTLVLDTGNGAGFRELLDPTVELSRHLFQTPTRFYKTGVVFLAWLAGHQSHFTMVGGLHSARSLPHLARAYELADRIGLFPDPALAASRMSRLLSVYGV